MKKMLIGMAGVFAAINVWALSIDSVTVAGATNASGAITVSANISGVMGQGLAAFQATSAAGLSRRYFHPTPITAGTWSNSEWDPYFTGIFILQVTAFDNSGAPPAAASTTVTVTRAISGTVNGIKYSSAPYDANGVWSNVDINAVKLHDIGLRQEPGGAASIGCNLLNANVTPDPNWSEEERDIAYTDTGAYKPAGTPYRFDVSLHARPRGFMGMGEIKRWIWSPTDTNNPNGSGTMVVDITAVSPWRSSYSNALQSHVGFAPIFAMQDSFPMPTGLIMCTSAHFMDVGPTNTGTQTEQRCGLTVNGHTGTNSYLKMFFSDNVLQQQFGLTNVYDATNVLAGFVQHFDTNGVPLDSVTEVTAGLVRIEGGTNIIYDYNNDGLGDSGYEARFNFEFHSAVAAQMGLASGGADAFSVFAADFDGDAKADPTVYAQANSMWKEKRSAANYALTNMFLGGSGYTALAADFDGDRLADPVAYLIAEAAWLVELSSAGYNQMVLGGFLGGPGYAALGADFDGDRLADPAVYHESTGTWMLKLSTANYASIDLTGFLGGSGYSAVAADFDGDAKADPAVYLETTGAWLLRLSGSNYGQLLLTAFLGGSDYRPVAADFDGDGLADPAVAQTATGNWKIMLSSGNYSLLDLPGFLGE